MAGKFGTFVRKVGKGVGALARGAANVLGFGGGDTGDKETNVTIDVGGLLNKTGTTTSLTRSEKRKASRTTENLTAWLKANWMWVAIPGAIVIGVIIWMATKKKSVGSSTRRRSTTRKKSTASKSSSSSSSSGRVKPNPKGTKAERQAWARKMQRLRKSKK